MKKIELLAPAGNLTKLKTALIYGADAVYIGGKAFSLRARANNFTLDDLKEGVEFAHNLGKKVYVTMNVVAREKDYSDYDLEEYLKYLSSINVDGIICSSMYIASTIINKFPNMEAHLSTQASSLNSESVKFYSTLGIKRVVLAREASIDDIRTISASTNTELEVFIHGGMCSSISGRCMLSNYFVNRDANRGGCAHSCRWNYDLFDVRGRKLNGKSYLNIASKDLCAIEFIKDLIEAGVSSLKIEGRMKSEYYIASIVKTYRSLIDDIYSGKTIDYDYYRDELAKAENRLTSHGFLSGRLTINEQLYDSCDHPTKEFVGLVLDYKDGIAKLEQRNYFKIGDELEFFGPNHPNFSLKLEAMTNEKNEGISVAPHPKEIIYISVPFTLDVGDMVRVKK